MNTPRLALLALISLCASFAPLPSRAADLTWDRTQNGDAWQGVNFTDENGVARTYYFRIDDTGEHPALYVLKSKADPLVKNSTALEAQPSAYTLNKSVTGWVFKDTSYAVTRAGTSLNLTPKLGDTWGMATWRNSPSAKYVELPQRGTTVKRRVRVDEYEPEKFTVVVGPPLGTGENLDPTPMSNYKENVPATAWANFYFDAPPSGRNSYSYKLAQSRYGELRRRVYPFEVIYDPKSCFVSQEGCNDAESADIAAAADEAAAGNLRTVDRLTKAGHERIKARVSTLRTALDTGAEDSFGPEETELLQKLLANYGQTKAFDAELNAARSKPEDLKKFVAKWRGYLKGEVDAYLKDPNLAKSEMPDRNALRKAQADRMQAAVAQKVVAPAPPPKKEGGTPPGPVTTPVKPPFDFVGGNLNGAFGGLDSSIGKPTPAKEWYTFTVTGGPGGGGKAYCRLGTIPKDYMSWVKAAAMVNRPFECVLLKPPVPKAVAGKLEAELLSVGSASFATPIPAAVGEIKMTFIAVPWATMTLSAGAPMRDATTFLPKWGKADAPKTDAPVPADAAAGLPATLLSKEELAWLVKTDASEYNDKLAAANKLEADKKGPAIAALVKEYRGKIAKNLEPDTTYAAAAGKADATTGQINAALPKERYGAPGGEIVGLTGPKTAVQLTKEEYDKLTPEKKAAYEKARLGHDGTGGDMKNPKFSENNYDPILLHAATMAARGPAPTTGKPAGKPDGKPDAKPDGKPEGKPEDALAPLTDAEIAMLTPAEKTKYEGQRTAANATPPNASAKKGLADLSKQYRDRIKSENRSAYPPELEGKTDITEKQFDDMQEWQKRRFCANRPVAVGTYANDQRAAGLKGGTDKTLGLADTQKGQGDTGPKTSTNQSAGTPNPWDAKCKDHRDNPPDISGARQNISGSVPDPGKDAEIKEEKPKPWVTAPLLIRGAQGALVGLLLGSLFGPIGLIAGPLIGAALFYGVSKYMTDKESDK